MEGKLHVRWYHCVSFIYLQLAAINNDNSSFLNISDGGIEKYEIGMSFVMNCFFIWHWICSWGPINAKSPITCIR